MSLTSDVSERLLCLERDGGGVLTPLFMVLVCSLLGEELVDLALGIPTNKINHSPKNLKVY